MVFEYELMQELPAGWKHRGHLSGYDPLDGKPFEGRPLNVSPGKCQRCGVVLEVKAGRGRKPKYCPSCAPKVKAKGYHEHQGRVRNLRMAVGVVPYRKRPFAQYLKYFNYGNPGHQRIFWQDSDFGEATITTGEARGFTSEWYFSEQGSGYFRPLISRASYAWSNVKARKLGSDCLNFIHEDDRAMPKGIEPEHAGITRCEECGGDLELVLASGRRHGAKIGSKVVACKSCGLVAIPNGVVSYPDVGGSNDYSGVP